MSTTTEIALLQQQVALLTEHVNWVIGGVTLCITVLLALFALIQFIYQRKLQKSELQAARDELKEDIHKALEDAESKLKSFAENSIGKVEAELKKDISKINGDISRRFALDCTKDGLHSTAFSWWLRAASEYLNSDSTEMFQISLKEARSAIQEVDTVSQRDDLFESATQITGYLEIIEQKYKTEAELLRDLFKGKCKPKSSKDT